MCDTDTAEHHNKRAKKEDEIETTFTVADPGFEKGCSVPVPHCHAEGSA